MYRYALIDADNVVTGVVIWDGVSQWAPPAGLQAVRGSNRAEVGYVYDPASDLFSAPIQEGQ